MIIMIYIFFGTMYLLFESATTFAKEHYSSYFSTATRPVGEPDERIISTGHGLEKGT